MANISEISKIWVKDAQLNRYELLAERKICMDIMSATEGKVAEEALGKQFINITQRKQFEVQQVLLAEALEESEKRLGFLLELSDTLRLLSDPVEIQVAVATATMDFFAADRCYYCEIEGANAIIRVDASDGDLPSLKEVYPLSSLPFYKTLLKAGKPVSVPDVKNTEMVGEDLRQHCIQMGIISYLDVPVVKDGRTVGVLCINRSSPHNWTESQVELAKDIAERMWAAEERARAEEEVRKSRDYLEEKVAERTKELSVERQRLFDVLETLPVNISLITPDYKIIFCNRAFRGRYGEPNGRCCYDIAFGLDKPCEQCEAFLPLETGQPHNWIFTGPDGSIFDVHNFPFTDVDGKSMILEMNIDITDQQKIAREMARLDRLNLIGEMAAGIGHEVRNPMTTVKGFLQLLGEKDRYAGDKKYFHLMVNELDRANSIISEFLSLAHNKLVELKQMDINKLLESMLPLIQADGHLTDKWIKLETTKVPDLMLDEKEIRQLVLNLVRNGLEAMPSGGTLSIGTVKEADEVILFIRDEGTGLSPEIIDKLGTPFVTTKEKGTGLGLAVCYSIAARHNARIDHDTDPSGTTFYVHFPVAVG